MATSPKVFISYSHDSDEHRARVLALSEQLREDGIETRLDQYLNGAPIEGWPRWMRKQLNEADYAIIVCTETYYRRFWGEEEPGKGKGVDWEATLITQEIYDARNATLKFVPVIFAEDQQAFIPEPLRNKLYYTLNSTANYQALYDFLLGQAGVEARPLGELKRKPRAQAEPLTFADGANLQSQISNSQPAISISRLPNMLTNDLFGRDNEVQMLNDAWANPHPNQPKTNVIAFVAFGGSGKSALVHHWVHEVMARENWRGAARVYAWSFWSQGSDQPQTSADPFIDAALRWFGDADPTAGSPWDKGERLARHIKQTRTLLILDGLEPLQHPKHTMEGRLKEQSMQALLKELAAGQPGLCVVSTREHVADLQGFRAPAVIAHDLEQLSPEAGASILRQQQIKGSDAELQRASNEFGNHALALTILASFLHNAYDGDLRQRHEIGPLTESLEHGGHARRVMTSYETWLRDAGEDTLLAVLRVLGLFNRPADAASLAALRAEPPIAGLTDLLFRYQKHKRWFGLSSTVTAELLEEPQWKQIIAKLRRLKLLTDSSTHDEVEAHPLLREHFRDQLQRAHPAAWQAGNLRLYEHLTRTAKEFPNTLEEMQPLFAAVTHGCAASRQQQTLDHVYVRRINRGNEKFSMHKLGAIDANLAAVSSFFAKPWYKPSEALTEKDQGFVLHTAGFTLRALGRSREAVQPIEASLEISVKQADWRQAARSAYNLSELLLNLGDLSNAIRIAQQGVEFAGKSHDWDERCEEMVMLADVLHQAGRTTEAMSAFRSAENLQQIFQPEYCFLYGGWGYRYCDILLTQGRISAVLERGQKMFEWRSREDTLIDIAFDHLTVGRACLELAIWSYGKVPSAVEARLAQAADSLHLAVDKLREAGHQDDLPRGLLARAAWARMAGETDRAQRDLAEAFAIAERGEMRLHLTDCHLESARLALTLGDKDAARVHYDKARQLIAETGYHRRDGELAELAHELGESI